MSTRPSSSCLSRPEKQTGREPVAPREIHTGQRYILWVVSFLVVSIFAVSEVAAAAESTAGAGAAAGESAAGAASSAFAQAANTTTAAARTRCFISNSVGIG